MYLMSRFRGALVCVLVYGSVVPACFAQKSLIEALPSNAIAAYVYEPAIGVDGTSASRDGLGALKSLADQAFGLGLMAGLDACARQWIDSLLAIADVTSFPHAVALLDIGARARSDGGHELSQLRVALIIQTGADTSTIERRIQHLLNSHTNSATSMLKCEGAEHTSRCLLRDTQLPDWAVIEWGRVDGLFVLTIGIDALDQIRATLGSKTKSLASHPWFDGRSPTKPSEGEPLRAFVNVVDGCKALDSPLRKKVDRSLSALGWSDLQQGMLIVGESGRHTVIRGISRKGGEDRPFTLAGPQFADRLGFGAIPDEATTVAVIQVDAKALVEGVRDAYLAARSSRSGDRSREFWRRVEAESGVSFEADILPQLGQTIVVHDHPRHALGLPIARTLQIQVSGDSIELQKKLDRLLGYAQSNAEYLLPMVLNHHSDGIWSADMGIQGPALGMTNGWIVLGLFPDAVRQNIARLKTQPTPAPESTKTIASGESSK